MSTIPPLATGKQSETIQNSVYVLIYEECTATLEKWWRQPEENNEIWAAPQIPWETRDRACSVRQQKACDRMLPPGGQVLGLARPQTKGLHRPSQMANSFIPRNEGWLNVPGSTGSHPLNTSPSCLGNNKLSVKETRGCTCKSCCHILQNTKNRVQESPKALLPVRQNHSERLLVLQEVLTHQADWWPKPSRKIKCSLKG